LNKAVLFLQKIGSRQDIENSNGITLNQIVVYENKQNNKLNISNPKSALKSPNGSMSPKSPIAFN
jgi:hypothetical protein